MNRAGNTFLERFAAELKIGALVLGLIGSIAVGLWALDARYARAGDLARLEESLTGKMLDVHLEQLINRRASLLREKFDRQLEAQKRPLAPLERDRLRDVTTELQDLQRRIELLEREQADFLRRKR